MKIKGEAAGIGAIEVVSELPREIPLRPGQTKAYLVSGLLGRRLLIFRMDKKGNIEAIQKKFKKEA